LAGEVVKRKLASNCHAGGGLSVRSYVKVYDLP
jgi:hypothetical protein